MNVFDDLTRTNVAFQQLDNNRDKLSSTKLTVQRKDAELQALNGECDALEAALQEVQLERDQLAEALAEREDQVLDLEKKLDQMDQLAEQDEVELKQAIDRAATKESEMSRLVEEVVDMAEGLQEVCPEFFCEA